jgi:AcrR family transcriptional regulator
MAISAIGRRRTAALQDGSDSYSQRRNEIIATGADVFRDRGYEATSLKDVAEKLGRDRASLYYYVSSKNELFQLVTRKAVEEVVNAAEAVSLMQTDPATRLRELVITTLEKYEAHYPYMFVYIQEDMSLIHSDSVDELWARTMVELGKRFQDAFLKIIDDGLEDGSFVTDHRHIAMNTIIGAINWTHRWFRPGGTLSGQQVGVEMSKLILASLRPAT